MNIQEFTHLNREQSTHLLDLQLLIQKRYQNSPVIYWHIIKKIRPYPCNLLAYAGRELVGFCSRFLFYPNNSELSLMIHPNFQNDFFIKQFIYQILKFVPNDHQQTITISTAHQHKPLFKPDASWEYLYSSYRLQWQGPTKKPDPLPNRQLTKATIEDFAAFKRLTELGFPNGTEMNLEVFQSIISDSGTQLWLLKQESLILGSIQVNQENKYYRISDITVLPEYRQQGLGHFLLKSIVHQLHQRQKKMVLDVESNNEIALNWYLGLGMKKINTADFWQLPYTEFIR